jgi:hypothetical protein
VVLPLVLRGVLAPRERVGLLPEDERQSLCDRVEERGWDGILVCPDGMRVLDERLVRI